MTHTVVSISLVALLVFSGSARAQTTGQANDPPRTQSHVIGQNIPFLEGSYLFKSNEHGVLFEAAVFPHLMFWQNFDSLIDGLQPEQTNKTASWWQRYWAVSLTPGVRLKMVDAFSEPVHTPSYMPRIDVQKMTALGRLPSADAVHGGKAKLDLFELHFAVEHHSNGQDGCLFTEQHVVGIENPDTAKCVPEYKNQTVPGTVNKDDGSFSTNQIRVGLNLRRTYLSTEGAGTRHYSAGIEYQRQFATDPDLQPFYSQNRLNMNASIAWKLPGKWADRMEVGAHVITALDHPVPSVSRTSGSIQLAFFPSIKGGFGAFVKGYWGQDPYNLGFLDNISRLEFGLTFDQDGLFKFSPVTKKQ